MNTYRMEFQSVASHKDGGVMATKHLVVLEAICATEALAEANRRFASAGLSSAKFKRMLAIRVARKSITTRVRVQPVLA